jgi:hypothetical protein
VRCPGYWGREAHVRPAVHGSGGKRHTGAHVVQVSNNRYGRTPRTLGSRPRLDSGRLGVVTLELPEWPPHPALLAAIAAGRPERVPGYLAWEPLTFEVDSGDQIASGIDDEALRITAPTCGSRFSWCTADPPATTCGWPLACRPRAV